MKKIVLLTVISLFLSGCVGWGYIGDWGGRGHHGGGRHSRNHHDGGHKKNRVHPAKHRGPTPFEVALGKGALKQGGDNHRSRDRGNDNRNNDRGGRSDGGRHH